jgi:hypothetical protein
MKIRKHLLTAIVLLAFVVSGRPQTHIDPTNSFSWGANIGWANWRGDVANGVRVGPSVLADSIWLANCGWLDLGDGGPANGVNYANDSATDHGVNLDGQGNLRGFAYGANIGWVNFETNGAPRINLTNGVFSGFAYGANVGWISLAGIVSSNANAIVYPPGDVNGDFRVTGADSLLINQVLVNLRTTHDPIFARTGFANGDVNQSGSVTGADSLLINQVLVALRSYVVTRVRQSARVGGGPTLVTIYGVGFPTNTVTGASISSPVNLALGSVQAQTREWITATIPAGGGAGIGTVNVAATPNNAVVSFAQFSNQ